MILNRLALARGYKSDIVAFVLTHEDYKEAREWVQNTTAGPDFHLSDRGHLTYCGIPVLVAPYARHSYLLEDTPEMPLIHMMT